MDASSDNFDLDAVREALIIQYMNVACLTLCVYHHVSTLSNDVSFIWKSPWNIPKVLYLLARYLPLIVLPLVIYLDEIQCGSYQYLIQWAPNVCLCICEMIFALRTWAVWDRSRNMAIFLSVLSPTTWTITFVMLGVGTPKPDSICAPYVFSAELNGARSALFISMPLTTSFYVVILVLCSIKAYQRCIQTPGTTLMRLVHFDGIFYYGCAFSLSLAITVCLYVTVWSGLSSELLVLQLALSSILSCRMLLRVREQGSRTIHGISSQGYPSGFTMRMDTLIFRQEEPHPEGTNPEVEEE